MAIAIPVAERLASKTALDVGMAGFCGTREYFEHDFVQRPGLRKDETFTRASGGMSYEGGLVVMQTTNDTPRSAFGGGRYCEITRENVVKNSTDFGASTWPNSWGGGTTITENDATSPTGETTACKVEAIDGSGDALNTQSLTPLSASDQCAVSCWFKNDDSTRCKLQLWNSTTNHQLNFDWSGATPSTQSTSNIVAGTDTYEEYPNDWWRISFVTTALAASGSFHLVIYPQNTGAAAGLGVWIWGPQVEVGEYLTSHMETTASNFTRATESWVYQATYPDAEGAYICHVEMLGDAAVMAAEGPNVSHGYILGCSNTSEDQQPLLIPAASGLLSTGDGTTSVIVIAGAPTVAEHKIGLMWKSDRNGSVDGTTGNTGLAWDGAWDAGDSPIRVGAHASEVNPISVIMKKLTILDIEPTQAQLDNLTTL